MTTFFMFGKYTAESFREMSAERTQQVVNEIERLGGKINAMNILLGEYDVLLCVSLPGIEDALKASVALTKLTGISFTTCPAVTVEAFDRLVQGS